MKSRFRIFRRRSGVFYLFDSERNRQESLKTKDRQAASKVLHAKNESAREPRLSLQIARAYLSAADPKASERSWADALSSITNSKKNTTKERWERAAKDPAFAQITGRLIVETKPEHLLQVLSRGTVSTNVHLRKLHNFCLDMQWLTWPILQKRQWPKIRFKEKRAITWEEHLKIIDREGNGENKAFYECLWHIGGSQSDVVNLRAEDIDFSRQVVTYQRKKSGKAAVLHFGPSLEGVLKRLPIKGFLFPHLKTLRESVRADLFRHRCKTVNVSGVTLHSYRYAFAERCVEAGISERWAMQMLGHSSKAVHRAYAKGAQIEMPSLEREERKCPTPR